MSNNFSEGTHFPPFMKGVGAPLDGVLFRELLLHLEEHGGFDDLYITQHNPIRVKAGGVMQTIYPQEVGESEMREIVIAIYDESGITDLLRGTQVDTSFSLRADRDTTYRYRINMVACHAVRTEMAISIVMRSIKSEPVHISAMGLPEGLLHSFFPKQGMVIVAGATGSGKSTLLSSIIRYRVEEYTEEDESDPSTVVLTYEAPIEYVHDTIDKRNSVVRQVEVGRGVPSFAEGVRNALRCGPEILLIGEMRDKETIEAGIRASMTGHLVFSTLHANSVVEVVRRMANEFPGEQQDSVLREIVANLRLVVVQYLAAKKGGGRVPLREIFNFTQEVRTELLSLRTDLLLSRLNEMVEQSGATMLNSARDALTAGLISEDVYQFVSAGA